MKDSYNYLVASHKEVGSRAAVTIVTNAIAALQPKDSEGTLIPVSCATVHTLPLALALTFTYEST